MDLWGIALLVLTSAAVAASASLRDEECRAAHGWFGSAFLGEEPAASGGPAVLSSDLPFSLVYGGKPLSGTIADWKLTRTSKKSGGSDEHTITCLDPRTGLEIECKAKLFANHPAVEWVLNLKNTGQADTPIIADVRPLDMRIDAPEGDITLHYSHGSTCTATDFLPIDEPVQPDSEISLSPNGGRSSDGRLPFFNLEWQGGGVVGAIGWSGQWAMRLHRDECREMTLQAGQQTTHFILHPGESVRTPRILLVMWQGQDRLRGHNLLRRLLVEHYLPRVDGQVATIPISQNTWYECDTGNSVTEQNQLEAIRAMAKLGVELYWLDAGWFEGGWPHGVGSWVPKPDQFPRGLRPLADEAHALGMRFILWFEPERVNMASRIAKEHPEWLLHMGTPGADGLYNLGDPDARQWLTDYLSKCVTDWGIDIYRNDFNFPPLPYWEKADAPDRQGISEIRYVEGLYRMWDDLLARHPGLVIDNCASGGRRIDLETLTRSIPFWRSDTQCCGKPMQAWDQAQTAGLSLYVPIHAAGVWSFDEYTFRSVNTTGTAICLSRSAQGFDSAQLKKMIEEARALRHFYLCDYYPLTAINTDETHWCGWQFDRPDMGEGFAMLFRREMSPYSSIEVSLRGLDPKASYEVEMVDQRTKRTAKGSELERLRVGVDEAPGSLLVRYKKSGK